MSDEQKKIGTGDEKKLNLNRRELISAAVFGWTAFTAAMTGMSALAFRFMFPNVNFEPQMEFIAGTPDDYDEGVVDERFKNDFGTWIVKKEGKLVALSCSCTHLGCIPNWLPAEGKFMCPCHGSGFDMAGINFEGPAPRPLERFKICLNREGKIVIDKAKIFRAEKGEWENTLSYINVA
jgi:cytochrome b6-f complex iron-sulfur subunit